MEAEIIKLILENIIVFKYYKSPELKKLNAV